MYPISDLKKVKANNIRFKLSWRGESFLNKPYLIINWFKYFYSI